jgi:UDP-glucose 4-epimerase
VHWISVDLSRPLDTAALPERIDAVIHLAQSRQYRSFPEGAADMVAVNVQSTAALLDYARSAGAKTFVAASSGGVYAPSSEPLTETCPLVPTTFYARTRTAAELLVEGYDQLLHTVILRFFFVYGPGQQGMLFPTLLNKVLLGEEIVVEGGDGMPITPIYLDDAVHAVEAALALTTSAVVNVAGSEVITIGGLVERMGLITGAVPRVRHTDAPSPPGLVADIGRLRSLLGVAPQVSLDDGLRVMYEAIKR